MSLLAAILLSIAAPSQAATLFDGSRGPIVAPFLFDGFEVPRIEDAMAVLPPEQTGTLRIAKDPTAKYRPIIEKYGQKYGVDADLIHAVMRRENPWGNPKLVSDAGAVGLMQLMPDTASQLGVNPWVPEQNIRGGVKHLKYLLTLFKDDKVLAVAAYNAGDKPVARRGRVPDYPETVYYVAHVFNHYYWLTGTKTEYEDKMSEWARVRARKVRAY